MVNNVKIFFHSINVKFINNIYSKALFSVFIHSIHLYRMYITFFIIILYYWNLHFIQSHKYFLFTSFINSNILYITLLFLSLYSSILIHLFQNNFNYIFHKIYTSLIIFNFHSI